MTSKLTREDNVQAVFDLKAGYVLGLADVEILKRVARMELAAMDSEPDCKERKLFCSTDTARMRKVISVSAGTGDAPLYRHAQQPVVPEENHIGSKNALDAIVSFIKGKSNPTVKCYEEVSEQLFKDNCHGIHSHVIEYILKLGEELEDLRAEQAEMQPVPVVPEEVTAEDCPALVKYDVTEVDEAWARGFNAFRAAMLSGGKP